MFSGISAVWRGRLWCCWRSSDVGLYQEADLCHNSSLQPSRCHPYPALLHLHSRFIPHRLF